jgi:ribose 5-phosphate isomerase B
MIIGLAADHVGYELKEKLKRRLADAGHEVRDFGAQRAVPGDDYPDHVIPLAEAVGRGEIDRGVALCVSGIGACIAANKVDGARAAFVYDILAAHEAVADHDANVVCLGAGRIAEARAWEMTEAFLNARCPESPVGRRWREAIAAAEAR